MNMPLYLSISEILPGTYYNANCVTSAHYSISGCVKTAGWRCLVKYGISDMPLLCVFAILSNLLVNPIFAAETQVEKLPGRTDVIITRNDGRVTTTTYQMDNKGRYTQSSSTTPPPMDPRIATLVIGIEFLCESLSEQKAKPPESGLHIPPPKSYLQQFSDWIYSVPKPNTHAIEKNPIVLKVEQFPARDLYYDLNTYLISHDNAGGLTDEEFKEFIDSYRARMAVISTSQDAAVEYLSIINSILNNLQNSRKNKSFKAAQALNQLPGPNLPMGNNSISMYEFLSYVKSGQAYTSSNESYLEYRKKFLDGVLAHPAAPEVERYVLDYYYSVEVAKTNDLYNKFSRLVKGRYSSRNPPPDQQAISDLLNEAKQRRFKDDKEIAPKLKEITDHFKSK